MNYIFHKLDVKINFLRSSNKQNELKAHYQAKFECYLLFLLGYFWGKNLHSIDEDIKDSVLNAILKPSVGTIIDTIRKVDIQSELFGNKKSKKISDAINKYPSIRNEYIGHGYSFEDDLERYLKVFEELLDAFEKSDISIISENYDIIYVENISNNNYCGISYKSDGLYTAWQCPNRVCNLQIRCFYAYFKNQNEYIKLSPFIYIEDESAIYIFRSIEEKLTGRAKYNRLLTTGTKVFESVEFQSLVVSNDGEKIKHSNGTIINVFTKNYSKYIDVGIHTEILNFLEKNKSSVYGTLWGHGGVGKTATIQYVCDILCQKAQKVFDYIIFLSAKDRQYNYYKGTIEEVSDNISSLSQIILYLNKLIFGVESLDKNNIVNYDGSLFIIIDDYETFSSEEKKNITTFISELNINHHKVIITTRSAMLISGVEIQTSELSKEKTIDFFKKVLTNEFPSFNISLISKDLEKPIYQEALHSITSGRPLFILQLAVLLVQDGDFKNVLDQEIKSSEIAQNFLYDRIMDYLSNHAKNMFLAIGLLANENDLTGLLNHLRYVLNMEDKEDIFSNALQELRKLKLITIEDKFFKVYSYEVYSFMKAYYQTKSSYYDGDITSRFNSIADKKDLDTDLALLDAADASRLMCNEAEVENKYRYIINREKTSNKTRLKAIFTYASYLYLNGLVEKTIKLFEDYYPVFRKDYDYIVNYSKYLWSSNDAEHKEKAISIIKDYFETNPKINDEQYLILLSISLIYSSILVIGEKDELKEQSEWNIVSDQEYKELSKSIRLKMKDIFGHLGKTLYLTTKNIDLMSISPECRHYVLNGLNHYVDLAIRLNKWNFGKEVCSRIIRDLPENFHKPYIYKKQKIESIQHKDEIYISSDTKVDTDMGIKLKEALKKQAT